MGESIKVAEPGDDWKREDGGGGNPKKTGLRVGGIGSQFRV
jgi:hypothetical protein